MVGWDGKRGGAGVTWTAVEEVSSMKRVGSKTPITAGVGALYDLPAISSVGLEIDERVCQCSDAPSRYGRHRACSRLRVRFLQCARVARSLAQRSRRHYGVWSRLLRRSLPPMANGRGTTVTDADFEDFKTAPSGLKYKMRRGTASSGSPAKVALLWLPSEWRQFDSSYDRRKPLEFQVGVGRVIKVG